MDAGAGRSSCRAGQSILGQPPGALRFLNLCHSNEHQTVCQSELFDQLAAQ